jgi:hypothetical protein
MKNKKISKYYSIYLQAVYRFNLITFNEIFSIDNIDEILSNTGRTNKRNRRLPASLIVYYVIAMALFMQQNSKEVLRCLLNGLRNAYGHEHIKIPCKAAISKARSRLSYEPLKVLYETYVTPIAQPSSKGAWYKQWRIVCLDGSTLEIPDEKTNKEVFSTPSTFNNYYPFPQIRFVSLVEAGTHVLFGAQMSGYKTGEIALAQQVINKLNQTMLCIADRGIFSYSLWKQACDLGAALLWRARRDIILPIEKVLSDGSYLSTFSTYRMKRKNESKRVRVIEYLITGIENKEPSLYRLVTTILDPHLAPADELAQLYQERWEIENAFDELKTHLRGKGVCLRSKTPNLIKQEFYGLMLAHFTVRRLIHKAALYIDEDPDQLSFTHSLQVIRRNLLQAKAFSPSKESSFLYCINPRSFRRTSSDEPWKTETQRYKKTTDTLS